MILRSAICFNVTALLLSGWLCQQIQGATVFGQIQLVQSKESAVKRKGNYSGVVVWLTSAEMVAPQPPRKHTLMLQKDKTFSPHILAVPVGTSVDFPNLDPIFHNAFSNFDGQLFDVALYPPGSSRTVRFDRPGIVRVFCNIHPSMSAIIVVLDSNHIAITDNEGQFVLPMMTPGKYEMHVFHERATPETLAALSRTVTVSDEKVEISSIAISEAGYLPVAHKNKYGQEYRPGSDDSNSYSLPLK